MSLKIKISKQSILPPESRPSAKRRIQRIDSDEEEDAADIQDKPYDPVPAEPRSKRARTRGRRASAPLDEDDHGADAAEEDVDIEGDIEDTRFLPEPPLPVSRSTSPAVPSNKQRSSNAAASSSKVRPKEKTSKTAKATKSSAKKPRRQVVWTDDEDEDFDDPDVAITDEGDFEPEPEEYSSSRKGARGKGGKGSAGKSSEKGKGAKKEEKEITFRDERKLAQPPADPVRRSKERTKLEDDVPKNFALDPLDEPVPKKRKLPPIKKNKLAGPGSTGPSTPAAAKPTAFLPGEKKETLTPAPTSNQVGVRKPAGASADLNLLDSSVYSELFKSAPGRTTPNSGLNRKQKEEERRKELHKMRDEARAKREAEARHAFDLQSSPEKIQRFEEALRLRHSMARYPNILGAAFKEIYDRHRAARAAVPAATEQR